MFYIYELIDPRDSKVFYVGKGSGDRANYHTKMVSAGRPTDNPHKDRKIRQIMSAGLEVLVNITVRDILDEDQAYDMEEAHQLHYGLENLTNICLGGRPPRTPWSDERKENGRALMTGNTINKGRKQTDSARVSRAAGMKAAYESGRRTVDDELRARTSKTHAGKIVSPETKEKISLFRRGKRLEDIVAPEHHERLRNDARERAANTIAKLSKAKAGKTYTEIYGEAKAIDVKKKQSDWSKHHPNRKEVTIDGITYCSTEEAQRVTGISKYLIRKYYR